MSERTVYCGRCGRLGDAERANCQLCGVPRDRSRSARAAGVAFVLNEVGASPLAEIITAQQRARISTHYEDELRELVAPQPGKPLRQAPIAAKPAPPSPVIAAPPVASAIAAAGASAANPPVTQRAAPPKAPAPPEKPADWSWLVEQQANLFLFAGAFLTVVAALIYVGYSGQAVDGSLKMALLVAYTLAFLAAGLICLRVPRVATAGQVFFAVGALLVPLNFVAARSVLSDENLNVRTMWVAGSVTTAAFYTAVAWLGLGRQYAFGAGVAFASAMLAIVVRTDVAPEWTGVCFVALAGAMALVSAFGPATLRARTSGIWSMQAHVIAAGAIAFTLMLAPFASTHRGNEYGFHAATLWFLPITFLAASAYAALPTLMRKQVSAGLALIAAFSGAFVSVVYAIDLAGEYYAIAFAALAVVLGLLAFPAKSAAIAARLPDRFGATLRDAGVGATAICTIIALLLLQSAAGEGARGNESAYHVETRWFVAIASALVVAFYAIDAIGRRERSGVYGFVAALGALSAAFVYGLDLSGEYYAVAFAVVSVVFGVSGMATVSRAAMARLPEQSREILRAAGVAATALSAGAVFVTLAAAANHDNGAYQIETRWFAAISAALVLVFYAIEAFGQRTREGVSGFALALTALCASVVYALDVSGEYFAFALIAPAMVLGAATLWAPRLLIARLAPEWRDDVIVFGRVAATAGIGVALAAAIASGSTNATYAPQFRVFLPIAFAAAAAFFCIDAARGRRIETSAALLLAIGGAIVSVAYAFDAEAAYYGAAFAAAGATLALGGRSWTPSWLDGRVRDVLSVAAFTIAWLPFEGAYETAPRVGAGVHLAAAAFYALAAVFQRSEVTLEHFLEMPQAARVRVTVGWLYAACLAATIGYLHLLNSLPGDDTVDDVLRLGYPMLAASLALAGIGVATRWLRPEFRMHLYVMSLAAALVSLTTPASAETLSVMLTVYVSASLALAVFEDEPVLAAPAAAFGFGAIAAWRTHFDAPASVLPIAFGTVAIVTAAAGVVLRSRARWAAAAGVCSAIYAVAAPATGFAVLSSLTHHGYVDGTPFYRTALYEWSTLSMALLGALMLGVAASTRRRWIIVPATATLTIALLLQIGRFDPENPQAYTAVIGAYLVLLGLVGLWKFRLIPELVEAAPLVEAIGAAVIMAPSMIQSLDPGGGQYEWIVLAEAMAFFVSSIGLRRRGMLAAAIVAMVLVAARVLFDAVNALPNWVVVMLAGMALLGIGMGILLGRERWGRWQESLLGWWAHGAGAAAP